MVDRLAPVPSGGTAIGTVHQSRPSLPPRRTGVLRADRPVTCPTKPPEPPGSPFGGRGGVAQDTVPRSPFPPLSSPLSGCYACAPSRVTSHTPPKAIATPVPNLPTMPRINAGYLLIRPDEE